MYVPSCKQLTTFILLCHERRSLEKQFYGIVPYAKQTHADDSSS